MTLKSDDGLKRGNALTQYTGISGIGLQGTISTPPPLSSNGRVTSTGDRRVTSTGDVRITAE